jgi:hypothetical protein
MTTGRIASIGPGSDTAEYSFPTQEEEPLELHDAIEEAAYTVVTEEDLLPGSNHQWLLPGLALLIIAGWSAFFIWAHLDGISAPATAEQWTGWIGTWAIPVLLVIALWLLIMRNSHREAVRFGITARTLSVESERLEHRLVTVNRELSLAREFIASQSRDIESLGRVACDRLSQHSGQLASLIADNGERVEAIASVSETALENMNRLRGELPVIANSARDMASQIGNAGRAAHNQLDGLVSGFHRLNEFGEASERQVQSLRAQVDATLSALDSQAARLSQAADARFDTLTERVDSFRTQFDNQEVEALAAIHRRADALSDEWGSSFSTLAAQEEAAVEALRGRLLCLKEESTTLSAKLRRDEDDALLRWRDAISNLQGDLKKALDEVAKIDAASLESSHARLIALEEEAERINESLSESSRAFIASMDRHRAEGEAYRIDSMARMEAQFTHIDAELQRRRADQADYGEALAQHGANLAERMNQIGQQIGEIAEQGQQVESRLAEAITVLTEKLANSRATLSGTDNQITQLTDASIRLLEIIRAATEHSREDLPATIELAQARLNAVHDHSEQLRLMLTESEEKARTLSEHVLTAQRDGRASQAEIEAFHKRMVEEAQIQANAIENLRETLKRFADDSNSLAERNNGQLEAAIAQLREAARSVATELDEGARETVSRLAERIGDETSQAIDRAVRMRASEAIDQLEQSAVHASGASREAAIQLRDQLAKVDELTGHLEKRVAHARRRAEEQIDNDFSRRVALITESLNSHAIDITKAMSNEVNDVAWSSYLKGDRGIFTRRAVRLLDNSESRAVAQIYEQDSDFRGHVNQYVHDFEAMLRQLLSTRDGHALSVTLLSSDMGKLYVALAQGIERLRN